MMVAAQKQGPIKWHLITCDSSVTSGEGVLAQTILELLRSNGFEVNHAELGIEARIRRLPFQLSRFIYILKFFEALFLKVILNRKVVYVNYAPLWNPMISLLALSGVKIGPITGSIGLLPLKSTLLEIILRRYLQGLLVNTTLFLLPNNQTYWAATPSVLRQLKRKRNLKCSQSYPFFLTSVPVTPAVMLGSAIPKPDYDFFIYSKPHVLKNFKYSALIARCLAEKGWKVLFVGGVLKSYENLTSHLALSSEMFDKKLLASNCYLHLTNEDAGIACMKAMFLNKEVRYIEGTSGMHLIADEGAFAIQYCEDPKVFVERLLSKISSPNYDRSQSTNVIYEKHRLQTLIVADQWLLNLN